MAHEGGASVQLTAVCAVASFLWISHTFESHTLNQWPRFSAFIVLLLSSGFTYIASYFSKWLPGSDGRFDERSSVLLGDSAASLPRRPRRYFVPVIVVCLVLRIETFHQSTSQLQCSTPGVESFLCTLIVFYDVFFGRKAKAPDPSSDPEDPWREITADIQDWFKEARWLLVGSTLLLNYGAFLTAGQKFPSTYFCSSLVDSRPWVISMQVAGLGLDGVIAILLWRVLAFTKTTRGRLRSLAGILAMSACAVWLIFLLLRMRLFVATDEPVVPSHGFLGVGWLYIFDMVNDSFVMTVLVVSTSLVASEIGPLKPLSVFTFASGLLAACTSIGSLKEWHAMSRGAALGPLYLLAAGFGLFTYTANMRSVLFIRRVFFLFILLSVLIGMTVYTLVTNTSHKRHYVENLVFRGRQGSDHWLRHASVSNTLQAAVGEYTERNDGRAPPPNFDKWFKFAQDRKTAITDHFDQIRSDIAPFWGVQPGTIRSAYSKTLSQEPDMALVRIKGHKVSHSYQYGDEVHQKELDNLVEIIEGFAQHLTDMEVPINLSNEPRVLTPWNEIHRLGASQVEHNSHLYKRDEGDASLTLKGDKLDGDMFKTDKQPRGREKKPASPQPTLFPSAAFREMEAQTCPAGSPGRTAWHWNARDFCEACAAPHSTSQFLTDWDASLERCSQPDLTRLHGFHMAGKKHKPFQQLLPVFSRHKADGFNDVLIPWPQSIDDAKDTNLDFKTRFDMLHWRDEIASDAGRNDMLRGNQKHRLLHLVNNASASDEVSLMLPTTWDRTRFAHERFTANAANAVLPFDVAPSSYAQCSGPTGASCDASMLPSLEFGPANLEGDAADPLRYRYVLLLDSDSGPPTRLLNTVRSASIPFVSTVFRTWFTERLLPWVHFVPIDVRFHGLHSTLAYFSGLRGRGRLAGRGSSEGQEVDFEGRYADAKWIALEGKTWAKKALRKEDMEIYLFRLLLEWGRVVSDDREKLGFKLKKGK